MKIKGWRGGGSSGQDMQFQSIKIEEVDFLQQLWEEDDPTKRVRFSPIWAKKAVLWLLPKKSAATELQLETITVEEKWARASCLLAGHFKDTDMFSHVMKKCEICFAYLCCLWFKFVWCSIFHARGQRIESLNRAMGPLTVLPFPRPGSFLENDVSVSHAYSIVSTRTVWERALLTRLNKLLGFTWIQHLTVLRTKTSSPRWHSKKRAACIPAFLTLDGSFSEMSNDFDHMP